MSNRYIMIEDDCASDAREHFNNRLYQQYGLTIGDFHSKGERMTDQEEDWVAHKYNGLILETFADAPQFHLRKEE